MEDKRVLVVGMGNSAMDIAVEASWVGSAVYLAARTPVHVIPKYVFGRPVDQIESAFAARTLPWKVRQKLTTAMLKVAVGDYDAVRAAAARARDAAGARDGQRRDPVAAGARRRSSRSRTWRGSRARWRSSRTGRAPRSTSSSTRRATGSRSPSSTRRVVDAPDNRISLYQRVFSLEHPDLAFVGLIQPLGAVMPLAEEQGRLIADWLAGRYALPARAEMEASVRAADAEIAARYVGSKRHTIQVDFERYLHDLRQERQRGASRVGASV